MDDEDSLEDLAHVGVLGMKWGHRKKGTGTTIRAARRNVGHLRDTIDTQKNIVKSTEKGSKQHDVETKKLSNIKVDYLRNPDRVIAARMTRGEKAAALIFSSLTLTLPVALAGVAGTSARSRRIERKQDTGAYTKK
jgi:hypothetical protein